MSEKSPKEENVQDTLFTETAAGDTIGKAADQEGISFTEVPEIDPVAAGAAAARRLEIQMQNPEIIAQLNEPDDVWKDIGGGNREEIVQEKLGNSLMKVLGTFQVEYNPVVSREPFIYKLGQGLDLTRRLAEAGSKVHIPNFVSGLIEEYKKEVEPTNEEAVKFFAEQCDASLAVLKNIMFRDIDDVIDRNPSPAWENPALKEALIEGIKISRKVFEVLRPKKQHEDDSKYIGAVEDYIKGLQDEFLTHANVPKESRSDSREKKRGRERAVKARRSSVTSNIRNGQTAHGLKKPANS